jgi:ubiquinone/menaquinone biosynthesis C-methylase UbiE
MIASEILEYYRGGNEEQRLTASIGRLEQIRTWEIIERHLPPAPSRVLDVGGGTGVYALPLARRGYQVHLLDPVPPHVDRARALSTASEAPLVSADVGDARKLDVQDGSVDAVLLFGPLYHLTTRHDRVNALAEARRVLVPGGLVLSAYISRFASACDGIREGALRDATFAAIVEGDLTNGIHQNPTTRPDWFTTAYFHRPEEIRLEIEEAGLLFDDLIAVEGPGWMNQDLDAWLDDDAARERLLHVLRRIETEPSLIGASAHMLAVAHR